MNLKSFGLIVASCMFASVLYGCATVDQKSSTEAGPGRGSDSNQFCTWTFKNASNVGHKIEKGSLIVKEKPGIAPRTCGIYESVKDELYIGDAPGNVKKVLELDAAFKTEGTCRYCYVNSSGGMTCVTYPGC